MEQFMVEVSLPSYLSQDFIDLIPSQRAFIDEMFKRGTISGYSLASDRSKLWVTFIAKSSLEVDRVIAKFPIYSYIEYKVIELAFHESAAFAVPAISLN
jgi:hypothetical protein